jgi:hypothetical protein
MHVTELESINKFHVPKRINLKKNTSRRLLAVEIEVQKLNKLDYRNNIRETVKKWGGGVVHDGSLCEAGFEITTAPSGGDYFFDQIDEICDWLTKAKAHTDKHCGLHVHIDARDFGWWEIRRLIKLYAKIEDALFSVVPKSRRESTYCVPCGKDFLKRLNTNFKPKECKKKVTETVYFTADTRGLRTQKYSDTRYRALNLHSWFYLDKTTSIPRGTVECRLFGGTTSATKIKNWGSLWAGILDWVYTHNDKQVDSLTTDSWETLLKVSPNDSVRDWLSQRKTRFAYLNNNFTPYSEED